MPKSNSISRVRSSRSGIVALIVLALVYSLTAMMGRYFAQEVGIFKAWSICFAVSTVFTAIVFYKKIDFKKFMSIGKRDLFLIVFRGLAASLFATLLYTLATKHASIGAVTAMQVVPITAVFGVLILGESLSKRKFAMIALAFVGALMIALRSVGDIGFGIGETLALAASSLFALSFVLRGLQTDRFNDFELALATTIVAFLGNYIFAGVFEQSWLVDLSQFSSSQILIFLFGGSAVALTFTLSNYGLNKTHATTANVILSLELVFGAVIGFLFYGEILSPLQFIGAAIILVAVMGMSYLETRNPSARENKKAVR
ncbi:hypothetical protein CR956_00030 [Candidatus Saccharibacteria bacterium]|nr:MAG: hypothetical protein CR956_00030 [Candidatus Saccharibacteria bacterium]